MTRETKIIIAVVVSSAMLVGGAVVAAVGWFLFSVSQPTIEGPIVVYEETGEDGELPYDYDDYGDYEDPIEEELRAAEKRLGPVHADLAPLLIEVADMRLMDGKAEEGIPLLERALNILEREHGRDSSETMDALGLLADAYRTQRRYKDAAAILERVIRAAERDNEPLDVAVHLMSLAAVHAYADNDERALPLVQRARRLVATCEARGECSGDELSAQLSELDVARIERALEHNDRATANRLMRDIVARAGRDGGDSCATLADVLFARVEDHHVRCEQLVRASKLEEADRAFDTIFEMLALAESAGDCTELVDPYLVSDLTLVFLEADLEAGHYDKGRARIERLSQYARGHFDRGELRDMVRYDVTDVVLQLAGEAAAADRLEDAHRLQRFILRLYSSMGLTDGPTMCEIVFAMGESDMTALEEHLMANEVDAAEKLVERLQLRYNDYRIKRCAPEVFTDLAVTFADHALDAADRPGGRASANRLMTIAQSLCRQGGSECRAELREVERELREPRY